MIGRLGICEVWKCSASDGEQDEEPRMLLSATHLDWCITVVVITLVASLTADPLVRRGTHHFSQYSASLSGKARFVCYGLNTAWVVFAILEVM